MNALLLTQHYPPEPGSGSIKMAELAQHLLNNGHNVNVVTGFPNYPYGKLYDGYRRSLYKREIIDKVNVIRVPHYLTSKRYNFIQRMMNHISFMLTSIYGGFLSRKPDLIYYYSPPLFVGFSSCLLGKIFRVPTVVEINDLWPQAPIALGVIKNIYLKKMAERFEKFIYDNTSNLFFYSKTMRDEVVSKGIPEKKTEIHPLWISTREFCSAAPDEVRDIKEKYGFNEKFSIMYAGYIGSPQGLDVMIEVAIRLKQYNDMIFVFVGDGPEKEKLLKRTKNYGLNNVKFIPFQPKEEIPAFLSSADVLFAHLASAPHRLGTIPGKVLAYMSIGKPLLIAAKGETNDLINRSKCGIVAEPGNAESIAEGILKLYGNAELRKEMGERARKYAITNFDKEMLLERLEERLQEIVLGK